MVVLVKACKRERNGDKKICALCGWGSCGIVEVTGEVNGDGLRGLGEF